MYPWEGRAVQVDVRCAVSHCLVEPYLLEFGCIAEHTPISAHRFDDTVHQPATDKDVERLTTEPRNG